MGLPKLPPRRGKSDLGSELTTKPARIGKLQSSRRPETGIQALVLELIEQLRECQALKDGFFGDEQKVLIDLEADGLRCVVSQVTHRFHSAGIELTPREQEVARMVAKGYPNKSIAVVLEISQWTVGTYLRRIFAKLNVNSRAAMVSRLLEEHILDHD